MVTALDWGRGAEGAVWESAWTRRPGRVATVWILVQVLLATNSARARRANPCGPCVPCLGQKPGRVACTSSGGGVGLTGKPQGKGDCAFVQIA